MLEVSDLIYETCKTYLVTQGNCSGALVFIGAVARIGRLATTVDAAGSRARLSGVDCCRDPDFQPDRHRG
jgi:hypothetical protein